MQPNVFRPLVKKGTSDRSVIIGAPESFSLAASLERASSIRIAIAFGHKSGWTLVADSIKASSAQSVLILLGTAFCQTEPELLLALQAMSQSNPAIQVKLANSQPTFHPKVWIMRNSETSEALVGSGNLSMGGLLGNVECSIYTAKTEDVESLESWFDYHWKVAADLKSSRELYAKKYEEIKRERRLLDEKIKQATTELAEHEGKLQKSAALKSAVAYWQDNEGKKAIAKRESALDLMRETLRFPDFDFDERAWNKFLGIREFGWIRQGHNKEILAALDSLKGALRLCISDGSGALDGLINVSGVGRNVATKLLAMCDPSKYVVFNAPVEAALRAFGISTIEFEKLNSQTYSTFLRAVQHFSEESDALGLNRAAALDSFFVKYRGTAND